MINKRKLPALIVAAFLVAAVTAPICSTAAPTEPQSLLARGIALYEKKDFAQAQVYLLKAVHGEFKDVALAHYYLANALMQTSKTNAALDEYERCYKLAPFSSFSGYCRMMLARHGRSADDKGGGQSGAQGRAVIPLPDASKFGAAPASGKKENDVAELPVSKPLDADMRALSGRLPRPVVITKETPPASEILAGNIFHRASFLSEAETRKSRAAERLEQARQTLTRAESVTHSFLPSQRKFGESDDEFRIRRAEAEKSISGLLDPFRATVKEAESAFQTESSLFESCLNASRGFF